MVASALNAISLYTGIGGLDFGFEAAGFRTAVAVELDSAACRTIRQNRPGWNLIERDIHDVSSAEILDTAGLQVGEADVLIGGPPCQPFSKSSYWVNGDALRLDDPRADTLTAYLRVLSGIRDRRRSSSRTSMAWSTKGRTKACSTWSMVSPQSTRKPERTTKFAGSC